MKRCVSRSDVFDNEVIQSDIIRLALDFSMFGCRLGKIKFCVVDHGKDVRVFQCAIHKITHDSKGEPKHAVSIISEVDE